MFDTIEVRDVGEFNDCAGRKFFTVTAMGSDETHASQYRLNHGWLPPYAKLELASVAQLDRVRVIHQPHLNGVLGIAGEYVENLSDTHNRDPVCRCGTFMVSDGFDVHCPNANCPLTLATRFRRLGDIDFFTPMSLLYDAEMTDMLHPISGGDYIRHCRPFNIITQGLFWGKPGGSLEEALFKERVDPPHLDTFLIPSLFESFLENPKIPNPIAQRAVEDISRFYGWMNETINRRDPYSEDQNRLLRGFLLGLGLEALTPQILQGLFQYESNIPTGDPIVVFAYVLTHAAELVNELGVHPLEASALIKEMYRRRYELHDIFYHYALNKADITDSFKAFM